MFREKGQKVKIQTWGERKKKRFNCERQSDGFFFVLLIVLIYEEGKERGASITISILFYVKHTQRHPTYRETMNEFFQIPFLPFSAIPLLSPDFSTHCLLTVSLLMIFFMLIALRAKNERWRRRRNPQRNFLSQHQIWMYIKLIERIKCAKACKKNEEELHKV